VEKVTVPSPDPTGTSFPFTASYDADGFSLQDGQSNDSGDLNPGTYSVAETPVPANWALTSATCSDGSDPASINLGPDEIVTCTFTNTLQTGAIQVHKTAKHAAAPGGVIDQAGVTFTVAGQTVVTDANGLACVDGLPSTWCRVPTSGPSSSIPDGLTEGTGRRTPPPPAGPLTQRKGRTGHCGYQGGNFRGFVPRGFEEGQPQGGQPASPGDRHPVL
jgi:hypothetical protein